YRPHRAERRRQDDNVSPDLHGAAAEPRDHADRRHRQPEGSAGGAAPARRPPRYPRALHPADGARAPALFRRAARDRTHRARRAHYRARRGPYRAAGRPGRAAARDRAARPGRDLYGSDPGSRGATGVCRRRMTMFATLTVFRKEMVDHLRDGRSILISMIYPLRGHILLGVMLLLGGG